MSENALVVEQSVYEKIIYDTFIHGAVRTALLIDDQFPTLAQVLEDRDAAFKKHKEHAQARRIYEMFKDLHVLCDIENDLAKLRGVDGVERARKSDLIVLDYHLQGEGRPTDDCTDIIVKLSETSHFNLVVVLTGASDLTEVWLDIATNLRGASDAQTKLPDELANEWDAIQNDGSLEIQDSLWVEYVLFQKKDEIEKEVRSYLEEKDAEPDNIPTYIKYILGRELSRRCSRLTLARPPHKLSGACPADKAKWILCDNVFVAIVKKTDDDASRVIKELTNALISWKPNVIQIILSEIQNKLEMGAFANDEVLMGSEALQTGLVHYVLSNIDPDADLASSAAVQPAMELMIGKLLEGVRRRIEHDSTPASLAAQLLADNDQLEWKKLSRDRKERQKGLIAASKKIVRISKEDPSNDVQTIFELNNFLSTEKLRRDHITTGTILRIFQENTERWWACMSPACDMTTRQPGKNQKWHQQLHPFRTMVAVSLEEVAHSNSASTLAEWNAMGKVLKHAEHGRHIFVADKEKYYCLKVLSEQDHPGWEVMLLENAGRIQADENARKFVNARIIAREKPNEPVSVNFENIELEVVCQLRPEYASRLLQATGGYFSRIGVDYCDIPQ